MSESDAPREVPREIYAIGGGWGNAVEWFDWNKRVVTGWKSRRPRKGDLLTCKMQSGKTAVWEFEDVKYERDPPDMFFGYMKDLGYIDLDTMTIEPGMFTRLERNA